MSSSFCRAKYFYDLSLAFFDAPNKWNTKGLIYEVFRHCETKNFRRKLVIPPIMHKIFRYPKFSETLKGSPWNFSALWDKKFSTENLDTPPPLVQTFSIPEIIATVKDSPTEIFGTVRQKKSTENRDITLWSIKFFDPRINETLKDSPLLNFSALWDKKFSTGNLDTPSPPPLWFIKFFAIRNFPIHQSVPQQNVSVLWDKNFERKVVHRI